MHRNATNVTRPPSLVDTLGTGFRVLNKNLAVLIVPLLLDLWYWLGPRISLRPLVERIRSLDPATWDLVSEQMAPALPADRPFDLRLEGQFPFWRRVYTLIPIEAAAQPIEPGTWYVGGFLALFGALIAINLVLTLMTVLYLLPLADVVRGSASIASWLRHFVRAWLHLLGVVGIVLAFLLVICLPLMTVAGLLVQLVPAAGYFVVSFLVAAVLWFIFTTSFAFDAVVVSGLSPLRAILASLLVVRNFFWGAIGLFLLNAFILRGFGIIWNELQASVPGLLLAMVSSAYVGAGLAAAHLVFYRDRLPGKTANDTAPAT